MGARGEGEVADDDPSVPPLLQAAASNASGDGDESHSNRSWSQPEMPPCRRTAPVRTPFVLVPRLRHGPAEATSPGFAPTAPARPKFRPEGSETGPFSG